LSAPIQTPYREYTAPESRYDIDVTLLRAAYDRMWLNLWLTGAVVVLFSPFLWQFLPHIWLTVWIAALAVNLSVHYACWVIFQRAKQRCVVAKITGGAVGFGWGVLVHRPGANDSASHAD